jgi:hypothetical protein
MTIHFVLVDGVIVRCEGTREVREVMSAAQEA